MKILITGGAGFIGSHLAESLLGRGHEVYVIDDLSTGTLENIKHLMEHPKFHYRIDTIMDVMLMNDLVKVVDQIYHLAAAVGVQYIIDNPLESLTTNVKGTEIVLELANKKKQKVFIASTSEVYGKHNKFPLSEEDDSIIGKTKISRWSYACAKMLDEFLALAYYREKALPVVIGRFFNVCGPRQSSRYGMVIPRFVKQAMMGNAISVYGDGKQSRCFAHVNDVVEGIIRLMEKDSCIGEIYNIGSNEEISIGELAKKILKMTGSNSEIDIIPYDQAYEKGFEDMMRRVPSLEKIVDAVGYERKFDLDSIIDNVIKYNKK